MTDDELRLAFTLSLWHAVHRQAHMLPLQPAGLFISLYSFVLEYWPDVDEAWLKDKITDLVDAAAREPDEEEPC
jgi:hypothetical protein